MKTILLLLMLTLCAGSISAQGSFAPNADAQGTSAIHKDSSVFIAWATNCVTSRGPQNITVVNSPLVTSGDGYMATGKSGVNGVVSLGDGGSATLTFSQPVLNGASWDFAVFENSFNNDFLELAFVEVSSDGLNFVRFPATTEVQDTMQVGSFGATNASQINNFAGKYRAQFGTPFDLEELHGAPGLDVNSITHIRIIDVIGSIQEGVSTFDSQGNKVNDPFPTDFASGGFDLDAIGVIHQAPLTIDKNKNEFSFYPNPTSNVINIETIIYAEISIKDLSGKIVYNAWVEQFTQIDVSGFAKGLYFIEINSHIEKLIVN